MEIKKNGLKKNKATKFWLLAVLSVVAGVTLSGIGQAAFNFNLYTQMSPEQKILVAIDQTNDLLLLICSLLLALLFVLAAIYSKIFERDVEYKNNIRKNVEF